MRPMSARKTASRSGSEKSGRKAKGARGGLSLRGDLVWAVAAIATGVLIVPPLVWFTGLLVIGPYANGGLWALLMDMNAALQQGSLAAWITLLAPLALVLIWRLSLRWLR